MADSNGKKYDVFISYRRKTGANDARLLEQALKARNFNVFFDFNSIRDGRFDERIYAAIKEAPVFILVMTSGALDTCIRENDWVRIELEYALKLKKKIIPVTPSDQASSFPEKLPGSLAQLRFEQISKINKEERFDATVDELIQYRFPANLQRREQRQAGETEDDPSPDYYEYPEQGIDPELVKPGLLGALIWGALWVVPVILIFRNMPALYAWIRNLHGWRVYPVVLAGLVWLNFIWQCLAVWGKFRKQYPLHPHFIVGVLILCALAGWVSIKKIIQEGLTLPVLGNSISMVAPACLIVFSLGVFPVNVIARDSLKKRLFRMLLIDLVFVFVLGVMFLAQITGILKF